MTKGWACFDLVLCADITEKERRRKHAQCTIAPCHTILQRQRNRHTCAMHYRTLPHNTKTHTQSAHIAYRMQRIPHRIQATAQSPAVQYAPIQCSCPLYNARAPYTMLDPLIQCLGPLYNAFAPYTMLLPPTLGSLIQPLRIRLGTMTPHFKLQLAYGHRSARAPR